MPATKLDLFKHKSALLKTALLQHTDETTAAMTAFFGRKPKYIVFLSVSNGRERADVFSGIGNSISTAWQQAFQKTLAHVRLQQWQFVWMKADLVNHIEAIAGKAWLDRFARTRKNYWREGLALDSQFNMAFLEQEIHANAFFSVDPKSSELTVQYNHWNRYIKNHRHSAFQLQQFPDQQVYSFRTVSYFHETEIVPLHNGELSNGRRIVNDITPEFAWQLIDESSQYLSSQVQESGQFHYGFFPCFHQPIKWYNMLRHASTTYSMIEAYEITRNEQLGDSIRRALHYLQTQGIVHTAGENNLPVSYVIDGREGEQEIKLGANAAAILAFTKYTTVFDDTQYLDLMRSLANGILQMVHPDGGFVHVLHYPGFHLKDAYRIIYYDGEAAFALMRLYAIDKNPRWLAMVEQAFEHFIANDYWKYHDHWLGYCTNELVLHKPLPQYFAFGLKNVQPKLDYILQRETTYPTFLELLMAAHKMAKQMQTPELLPQRELLDSSKLRQAIEHRAQHQLNGYFFPEVAMYFKKPLSILQSFFIRHHGFRNRIDDIEHNLSGYCSYYQEFLAHQQAGMTDSTQERMANEA